MEKAELLAMLIERADEGDAALQVVIAAETDDAVIYDLHVVGRALATLKAAADTAAG